MRGDRKVEAKWLEMLSRVREPGQLEVRSVEPGYDLVVRWAETGSSDKLTDLPALDGVLPNLSRTRSVYLSSEAGFGFENLAGLRDWAGAVAELIESGAVRAFAVVDVEQFGRHLADELRTRGWPVETKDGELCVRDGHFIERVHLLREIVRMVLSRRRSRQAAAAIARELKAAFARAAGFYARFEKEFREFEPEVLDHYFVAYPCGCCVALGWDYWRLSESSGGVKEQAYDEGVAEFKHLLSAARDGFALAGSSAVCGRA
jgi:hypothetical protein